MVRDSHEETRRSIAMLRHDPATAMTLSENLRDCVQRMVGNEAPRIDIEAKGQLCVLPPGVESALLRIGQEAMANAVGHSGSFEDCSVH